MSTRATFVRSLVLTCLLFAPAGLLAQTPGPSMSRQTGPDLEYQVGSILWTQTSAEYRALAYQAFDLAKLRLDQALAKQKSGRAARGAKPMAIIVDVDETVLDNSRFQAELILRGVGYTPQAWQAWCDRAEAGAVPGAAEFLNYAAQRGVQTFYITNRRQPEKAGTMTNLKNAGFPGVTEDTVMIRENASASKETRREKVRARYRVVMLVGDNLNDFSDNFSGKSIADRKAEVDRERAAFGSEYIVIPNPMYGDWESAVYGNQPLSESDRRTRRRETLRGVTVQPGP
ncbi:MAG TPA: 5'-nucleotidase, lipoprotein e(P4) family [Pyrinomonadaceae bacterium]|nr:5'-nucleotidase, lipoprotein e(P4) family [Pyrinomonadaceae bacterium]